MTTEEELQDYYNHASHCYERAARACGLHVAPGDFGSRSADTTDNSVELLVCDTVQAVGFDTWNVELYDGLFDGLPLNVAFRSAKGKFHSRSERRQ